jgi:hypothetical protein
MFVNCIIDSFRLDTVESLEDEIIAFKYDIPNSSRVKFEHILNSQKICGDKGGLGFDKDPSTSKTTPVNK